MYNRSHSRNNGSRVGNSSNSNSSNMPINSSHKISINISSWVRTVMVNHLTRNRIYNSLRINILAIINNLMTLNSEVIIVNRSRGDFLQMHGRAIGFARAAIITIMHPELNVAVVENRKRVIRLVVGAVEAVEAPCVVETTGLGVGTAPILMVDSLE